jgi:hypothetical protein
VLGGYAVNFYGYHRNTADFDVWIAVDSTNAGRISKALRAFGFSAGTVPPSLFKKKGPILVFGRKPWRVDLLTQPSGVEFDACYDRRNESAIDGVRVPWISFEDLKTNKLASGRIKDLADLERLTKLERAGLKKSRKKSRRRRN